MSDAMHDLLANLVCLKEPRGFEYLRHDSTYSAFSLWPAALPVYLCLQTRACLVAVGGKGIVLDYYGIRDPLHDGMLYSSKTTFRALRGLSRGFARGMTLDGMRLLLAASPGALRAACEAL